MDDVEVDVDELIVAPEGMTVWRWSLRMVGSACWRSRGAGGFAPNISSCPGTKRERGAARPDGESHSAISSGEVLAYDGAPGDKRP